MLRHQSLTFKFILFLNLFIKSLKSTFALPNRLTQVALYPQMNNYLKDKCSNRSLDFFPRYTREQCLHECAYKVV